MFCKSSRGSFEMVEPNRFSGLADPKPRTPRRCPCRGYLGYFVSGFMVLGFPLVFFRKILEREFQKCEAQRAFLPGFIWEPPGRFRGWASWSGVGLRDFSSNPRGGVSKVWSRSPETTERRRRDRRAGIARAIGTIQQTHGYSPHG